MNNPAYRIYPTLLDSFVWMQSAEDEESRVKAEADLIDKLNRKPTPSSYAATRGTALNEVLDAVIAGTARCDNGAYCMNKDGYAFTFDPAFLAELADWVGDAVCQPFLKASIQTSFGEVELYGFADYIVGDTIIDLKSTDNYSVGKYREKWQHRTYPLLAVKSGDMESVDAFEYLVAELDKNVPQGGKIYREDYNLTPEECERELRTMLEVEFLPWLESKRELITDKKVFGE